MEAWGRTALTRLRELDDELGSSVLDVGDERCLVFARPATAQLVMRASLALRIDALGVRASLELPAARAPGVRARLTDPARALEVTAALQALPEQFAIGVDGDKGGLQAPRCTTDGLRQLLDRVERSQRALRIDWHVPRQVAARHAAILEEELEDAVVALGEVLVLLADEVDGGSAGVGTQRRPRRRGRRHVRDVDDDRGQDGRRVRALGRERERDAEMDTEPELPPGADTLAPPLQGVAGPGPALRAGLRRRASVPRVDLRAQIKRGARVRVLEGPFSGKVGVVQDLDGKGGARVLLGLFAVHVGVKDLAASFEGRKRPLLATSHRKLPPVRS
jgi:transcription antitermination factor NusG